MWRRRRGGKEKKAPLMKGEFLSRHSVDPLEGKNAFRKEKRKSRRRRVTGPAAMVRSFDFFSPVWLLDTARHAVNEHSSNKVIYFWSGCRY